MICESCGVSTYCISITRTHKKICGDCRMISPTGGGIRLLDDWGSGEYLAPRGSRLHLGSDYIVMFPKQEIVAPINGIIIREKFPYSNPVKGVLFSGVLIQATNCMITLFYFEPYPELIKGRVSLGQPIGIAQDIGLKYPEGYYPEFRRRMTPHIHLQIDSINPEILIHG